MSLQTVRSMSEMHHKLSQFGMDRISAVGGVLAREPVPVDVGKLCQHVAQLLDDTTKTMTSWWTSQDRTSEVDAMFFLFGSGLFAVVVVLGWVSSP